MREPGWTNSPVGAGGLSNPSVSAEEGVCRLLPRAVPLPVSQQVSPSGHSCDHQYERPVSRWTGLQGGARGRLGSVQRLSRLAGLQPGAPLFPAICPLTLGKLFTPVVLALCTRLLQSPLQVFVIKTKTDLNTAGDFFKTMLRKGSVYKFVFPSFFLTSKIKTKQPQTTYTHTHTHILSQQPRKLSQIKKPISDGVSRANYLTVFF